MLYIDIIMSGKQLQLFYFFQIKVHLKGAKINEYLIEYLVVILFIFIYILNI